MKTHDFTLIAAALILVLSTYNAIDDAMEDTRDENFYSAVFTFMARGDRNTAAMGYTLCMRANESEIILSIPPTDCCAIYFPDSDYCKK